MLIKSLLIFRLLFTSKVNMIAASIRLSKENKTENVYEDIKVKVLT